MEESAFTVWPENRRPVELFVALRTQWRFAGMGGRTGLDYTAVCSVMDVHGIKDRRSMLDALQVMEDAALDVWDKARDD